MTHLLLIFLAGFASVFLLGFQSRCVNHGNFAFAACGSFLIAIMQTTLWGALFRDMSWAASIAYGLSGATGITSSMFIHQRVAKPKPQELTPEHMQEIGLALYQRGRKAKRQEFNRE